MPKQGFSIMQMSRLETPESVCLRPRAEGGHATAVRKPEHSWVFLSILRNQPTKFDLFQRPVLASSSSAN